MLHMPPRLHTTGEIAKRCSVDRSTVHRWIETGQLAVDATVAGIRLVTDDELTRFLAERDPS